MVVVAYFIRDGWDIQGLVLSALNHEACDDSVEDGGVVEALIHQVYEVLRCDGLVVS